VTGHLAKDLTFYWMQSEQVPSAVGIAVKMDGDHIVAAGGFLVQALPGASEKEVKLIDDHIQEMHSLAQQFAINSDPLAILSTIFQDTAFVILEEKPLEFRCTCSWERVKKALTLVGTAELSAMLKEDKSASVRCDFCTKEYRADAAELQRLIDAAREREGG
jgi:molecular chaperone Hsp33